MMQNRRLSNLLTIQEGIPDDGELKRYLCALIITPFGVPVLPDVKTTYMTDDGLGPGRCCNCLITRRSVKKPELTVTTSCANRRAESLVGERRQQ